MNFFKVTNTIDGEDDPLYVECENEVEAYRMVTEFIGDVPRDMLLIETVDSLPFDELPINSYM